jgi:hypothetical protein
MSDKKIKFVKEKYIPRITDITLLKMLKVSKAILIEGPK